MMNGRFSMLRSANGGRAMRPAIAGGGNTSACPSPSRATKRRSRRKNCTSDGLPRPAASVTTAAKAESQSARTASQ
jgi:hypothetical protein